MANPFLLNGDVVLAPPHTGDLDTLPLFDAAIGCWDSRFPDIFELAGFLMLVQIVSGKEKHGKLDYGYCTAM